MRDPAREQLTWARGEAERRAASAISAIVRCVAGGLALNSERVLAERSKYARAKQDLEMVAAALHELDIVDGVAS